MWILHYNCTVSPSRYLLPSGSTSVSLLLGRLARSCDFLRHRQRQRAKRLATDRPTSRSGPDIRRKEGYFSFPFRNQTFSRLNILCPRGKRHSHLAHQLPSAVDTTALVSWSLEFSTFIRPRRSYRNRDKCDQDDLDNEALYRVGSASIPHRGHDFPADRQQRPRLAHRGGHPAPEVRGVRTRRRGCTLCPRHRAASSARILQGLLRPSHKPCSLLT